MQIDLVEHQHAKSYQGPGDQSDIIAHMNMYLVEKHKVQLE